MVETATKSGIVIREIVDETTINKVDTRPLEKALGAIDLSKYGTGIKKILFIVVALPPGSIIHKDEVVYDRRKRKLTLELNLSYLHVLKSTTSEVLSMAAKLFLDSIDLYTELKICDFEIQDFKDEAKQIFTTRKWIC
jgi:hypothetical protein